MINIIKASREFSKVDLYKLTLSPEIVSVNKLADNERLEVTSYVCYQTSNNEGEVIDLLSLETLSGVTYCTQSTTFISSFTDIAELMETLPVTIKKISGKTKSGRNYVNCVLCD